MNAKWFKIIAAVLLIIGLSIVAYKLIVKPDTEENNSKYLVKITFDELEEKITNKDSFPLIITKDGCGYCELFLPTITEVADDYEIYIYDLNISELTAEETTKIKEYFTANSTPTTLFITNGEEKTTLNRITGNVPKQTIIDKLILNKYIEE